MHLLLSRSCLELRSINCKPIAYSVMLAVVVNSVGG